MKPVLTVYTISAAMAVLQNKRGLLGKINQMTTSGNRPMKFMAWPAQLVYSWKAEYVEELAMRSY